MKKPLSPISAPTNINSMNRANKKQVIIPHSPSIPKKRIAKDIYELENFETALYYSECFLPHNSIFEVSKKLSANVDRFMRI